MDFFRACDFADHGFYCGNDFILHRFTRWNSRFQRNINFRYAAFHFVHHRYDRGFRNFWNGEARGFQLLGAEPMARDVDDIVDAPENSVITVSGQYRAIGRVVRPVAPVFALRTLVIFFVVLIDEALRIAPDGLHDARPRIADTNISRVAGTRSDFLAVLIPNDRVYSERSGARATRFH